MEHDFSIKMSWCRRCGRPLYEIVDNNIPECDGLPGVVHARFLKAEADMEKIFGPIIDEILGSH